MLSFQDEIRKINYYWYNFPYLKEVDALIFGGKQTCTLMADGLDADEKTLSLILTFYLDLNIKVSAIVINMLVIFLYKSVY